MPSDELPLFPLRLVLFPGAPQLLHVFEMRYRALLADCLDGNAPFGLPLLGEDASGPEPGDVGSLARIESHQRLDDGRANILVIGGTRFAIESIVPSDTPYAVARVRYFGDRAEDGETDLGRLANEAWQELQLLQERLGGETSPPHPPADPQDASFLIAAAFDADLPQKEAWLRLTSTRARLTELLSAIRARRHEVERALSMAERARGNGRGDTPVDQIEAG